MDTGYLSASVTNLVVNLVYVIVALGLGVCAVRLIDLLLYRKIDFEEEIKKGNLAAAIFASMLLLFVALVLIAAMGK